MKLISLVLAALALCVPAFAQIPETGSFSELYDVNRLMFPRDGITYQVSSYDRTGGNDDGFSGKYSFIRKEGEEFVIFDSQGPGCIYRIWSANPGRGRVRFYFDGETTPRIDVAHFEDLFTGGYFPFVKPIVANFLGGWNSYVPIPFAKSCKIVAQGPVQFLQITWRKFTTGQGVKTFSRDLPAGERSKMDYAVMAWSNPGDSPAPLGMLSQNVKKQFSSSAKVIPLADLKDAGVVRALRLKISSQDRRIGRNVLLRVFTDGKRAPDVWSPVGDFFMTGLGGIETRGLLTGVKDGQMYSYFPMPYAKGMRIELANEAGKKLEGSVELVYEPMPSLPKDALRFNAWWHRQNPTVNGQPFPILEAKGRGHWCGVSHYMNGTGGLGFLEGDEMLWVDGRDHTHYNGTGTEDYFCCGWYFGGTGCQPLYGCTVFDDPGSRIHAYRIHLTDLVPFQHDARVVIEHGPGNDINADYAGVTYWYAEPGTTHGFAPVTLSGRFLTSPRIVNTTEAESVLAKDGGKCRIVEDSELPVALSSGKGVAMDASDPQGRINLSIKTVDAGACDLIAWFAVGPSGGKFEAYVDGKPSGDVIDTHAAEPKVVKMVVASLEPAAPAAHDVSFVAKGKSDASADGQILLDCVKLVYRGMVEAERLQIAAKSPGDATHQPMSSFGNDWSNDSQVFFRAEGTGAYITFDLPVKTAGSYRLWACMTQAGDYGIVQTKLDDKPAGGQIDGFADRVVRTPRIDLGTYALTAGNHKLTFEVVGKSPRSANYYVGIDGVILEAAK